MNLASSNGVSRLELRIGRCPVRSMLFLALMLASAAAAGCSSTPKSPEERSKQAVALYKEGVQECNEGKLDAGISLMEKANELQPGYTLLKQDLGRMLLVRGQREDLNHIQLVHEAKQARRDGRVDEAKKKEEEANALFRAATTDYRKAQGHLLFVSEQWPQEPNVPFYLAIIETGLGDYDQARSNLKRAMEVGKPQGEQRANMEKALENLSEAELQRKRKISE